MGRGGDKSLVACGSCCFGVLFVVAAGLVGGSFQLVQPMQYGLSQNTINKNIDGSKVYLSGRYFLGLGHQFITFPSTQQHIEFATSFAADSAALSVTISGQGTVGLECSLQYSLQNTTLLQLYQSFGTTYESRFISTLASAIPAALQAATNVTQFYNGRAAISSIAYNAAVDALAPLGANVVAFQVQLVTLPANTETTINNKLVSNQQQYTALNVQLQTQENAQIAVVVGSIAQQITLYVSNQTQTAAVVSNTASARANGIRITAAATAYTAFPTLLGFNNSDLLKYIGVRNLRNALPASATITADFSSVSALLGGPLA